jgi:endoglucanase
VSSRVRYLDAVTRHVEKCGWSWDCWLLKSDFILYCFPDNIWINPIRDALIPPAKP